MQTMPNSNCSHRYGRGWRAAGARNLGHVLPALLCPAQKRRLAHSCDASHDTTMYYSGLHQCDRLFDMNASVRDNTPA